MIVDIDDPATNGEAYCKKIKELYKQQKIVPYVSQQCFDNDDVAIVEEISLDMLYPVITAWTNEEVKEGEIKSFDIKIDDDAELSNEIIDKIYQREN